MVGCSATSGKSSAALFVPTAAAIRARRISPAALPEARSQAMILAHPRQSAAVKGSGSTLRIVSSIGRAEPDARNALTPAA